MSMHTNPSELYDSSIGAPSPTVVRRRGGGTGGARIKVAHVKELLITLRPSLALKLQDRHTMAGIKKIVDEAAPVDANGCPVLDDAKMYNVSVTAVSETNIIGAIKLVREITNLGLKEAKDVVDTVRDNGRVMPLKTVVSPAMVRYMFGVVKHFGFITLTVEEV